MCAKSVLNECCFYDVMSLAKSAAITYLDESHLTGFSALPSLPCKPRPILFGISCGFAGINELLPLACYIMMSPS